MSPTSYQTAPPRNGKVVFLTLKSREDGQLFLTRTQSCSSKAFPSSGGAIFVRRDKPPRADSVARQPRGDQRRGLAGGDDPQLVRGTGGANMQLITGVICFGVALGVDVHQHDVVELQALHLSHFGDLHPRTKRKVEVGDPPQVGHLGHA